MAPISPPQPRTARKPSFPNQRATVRYRCPPATAGRVYVAEDLAFERAWLQDLSIAGIGLLLGKPLDRGLFVTIQLKGQISNKSYGLPAHVVHTTQQSGGDWLVGFEFVTPMSGEDLDDLL